MAWLALDRATRIAENRGDSIRQTTVWRLEAERLREDVLANGYDPELDSYTASYGLPGLDASLLLLPEIGFEPLDSKRVTGTIEAVRRTLGAGGPLLYRYRGPDGLPGDEGAFLPCSFWLVEALALTGRRDEARDLFEELLGNGGPLGLFAEEIDPASGRHLGNFPQALTHSTLLRAAAALRV
jgi:GH15 family glucan-1,4-alpha-glucosidase